MKKFNKLVRDNIPEIIVRNGGEAKTRILSYDEFIVELDRKFIEEKKSF